MASEVGVAGFEPATSALSGQRSNQLSYTPFGRSVHRRAQEGNNRFFRQLGAVTLKTGGKKGNHGPRAETNACRFDLRIPAPKRQAIPRKEVIQPQVPLRLPCYDFTPVTDHSLVGPFLAVEVPTSGATDSHGVTGGVYKARERIHRSVLISDY
jgi:hypothetical protein